MAPHGQKRRRYTEAEKAEAVDLYQKYGPAGVKQRMGIPKPTVVAWAKRLGVKIDEGVIAPSVQRTVEKAVIGREKWAQRRVTLTDKIGENADLAALKIRRALEDDRFADAKNLSVVMGIHVDKAQLLAGDPTERFEAVGLNGLKHAIEKMVRSAQARIEGLEPPLPDIEDAVVVSDEEQKGLPSGE